MMAKVFKCEGTCGRTFSASEDDLAEKLEAARLWPQIPAEDLVALCPDCDRAFRKWYAKNFGVRGGRA